MTRSRVIPFLLLKNGSLVKTKKFSDPTYIGDPINAVKIFNEKEVDELVLLDIGATSEATEPNYALISEIASEAFMPIGYGGGITDLSQIEKLFKAGVEKISLNSVLFENPRLVEEAACIYGSQSIVVSVDVKRDFLGRYAVYSRGGRQKQKVDLLENIKMLEQLGAGEIVLNSIDRDGMMAGYDLTLIERVSKAIPIPLICMGGAGTVDDLRQGIAAGASAVGAGSMFVFHGRHNAVLISYIDPDDIH